MNDEDAIEKQIGGVIDNTKAWTSGRLHSQLVTQLCVGNGLHAQTRRLNQTLAQCLLLNIKGKVPRFLAERESQRYQTIITPTDY